MSVYTPTTWAILNGYMYYRGQNPAQSADEFHRWLAEVKVQAWHEGFCRGEVSGQRELHLNPYTENPYKEYQ